MTEVSGELSLGMQDSGVAVQRKIVDCVDGDVVVSVGSSRRWLDRGRDVDRVMRMRILGARREQQRPLSSTDEGKDCGRHLLRRTTLAESEREMQRRSRFAAAAAK